MVERFFGNSLWFLVKQSDVVTKLVLLILLVMSIVCWAIFFYKIIMLRIKRRQLHQAIDALRRVTTMEGLLSVANKFSHTLPGYLISKSLVACKYAVTTSQGGSPALMSESAYVRLQETVDQIVIELLEIEESYVPMLSVSAAVSPLLGLFGTIWGLVHAFVRIGELQTADIATVAPGIAEALITTLAGLIVAIPALVMYHYIINKVRAIERQLWTLADQINLIMYNLCPKE